MPTRSASSSLSREADADAIGLQLVVAREIDLVLRSHPLGSDDAALDRLPAADRPEEDRRQQGRRGGEALLLLVADHARDVVLRDVRGLVRHDARELRLARGGEHQAVVDEHEPARDGKRVDAGVLDHEVLEAPPAFGALGSEPQADPAHVFADFGILEQRVLITQLPGDHGPEAVFIRVRQHRRRRASHVGQVGAGRRGAQGERRRGRRLIRGGCGGEGGQGGRDERRKQAHDRSLTATGGPEFLHGYRRLQAGAWLRAPTAYTYRMSDAKSASRERSPRTSVTCPECAQPRKRLTA